jgi:cyclomaltodextrinase
VTASSVVVPDWVKDAVFYQIFPDAFGSSERVAKPGRLEPWDALPSTHGYKGGDLLGVVERLDYLQDLGVNALYFCPVFQSASNHRYHTHDYYRVDPLLGGGAALRELLDRAHERGMRIVLDGVFNHASRGFLQFNDILENGAQSPYVDWFVIRDRNKPLNPYDVQAILSGKSTWETNYQCWWNLPALPEFNTDHPEVREFLWNVATHWVEVGIDGWRLDVPADINDPSFWREFRRRVKNANPDTYLVGEIWHPAQEWLMGDRFDAVMNYVFNRACQGFFGGSKLDTSVRPGGYVLEPIRAQAFASRVDQMLEMYPWDVSQAQLNLLGSHDTPRILSILGDDVARLKLAVLFQMTFVGAPCIYYGDELGMASVPVSGHEGRAAMPWDERRWNVDLRNTVKRYVALRRRHPALRRGAFVSLYADDAANVYAFVRRLDGEALIVVLNNGERRYEVSIPVNGELADGIGLNDLLEGGQYVVQDGALVGPPVVPQAGLVLCAQPVK